jgi:hypothetical protein
MMRASSKDHSAVRRDRIDLSSAYAPNRTAAPIAYNIPPLTGTHGGGQHGGPPVGGGGGGGCA